MKLLNKTTLYFVGVSMVVFSLGGILFFLLFQVIIANDLTRKLDERKNYIIKQINLSDSLILYQRLSANTLNIRVVGSSANQPEQVSDTVIYDEIERKAIGYRQLSFSVRSQGKNYIVHIRRALVEQTDLIKGVVLLESILFLAFVAILTLLNNQLSRRLWRPFYGILDTINTYKLDRAENLSFQRNSISEFDALAVSIEKMSAKINQEYLTQKEFIENASHEIQTPLAIVRSKMEVLLQTPGFSETQLEAINAASMAANRLSKINEALLILSRIENRQFHVVEDISVNDLLEHHLSNFQELLQMKKIHVKMQFKNLLKTKMNPFLADMLLENLITNAIKHNIRSGVISIAIEGREVVMTNSGDELHTDTSRLFKRFVKSNQKSSSLGLGLPIVKAIGETYSIPIRYTCENNMHIVHLKFPTLESLQN